MVGPQKIINHFRENSDENNAERVAVLPGSASAFWMEATFHSRMQMQIQERLGLLL